MCVCVCVCVYLERLLLLIYKKLPALNCTLKMCTLKKKKDVYILLFVNFTSESKKACKQILKSVIDKHLDYLEYR